MIGLIDPCVILNIVRSAANSPWHKHTEVERTSSLAADTTRLKCFCCFVTLTLSKPNKRSSETDSSAQNKTSTFLIHNSNEINPVSNIEKDENQREEQPGEKLHSVEKLDVTITCWRFSCQSASSRLHHSLHLLFSRDPDRLLS